MDSALRVRVAKAELQREAGISELLQLSESGTTAERALALRALGRIGAPVNASKTPLRSPSIDRMLAALSDPAPEVVAAGAAALGLIAAIDGAELAVDAELSAAVSRAGAGAASVLEALGFAGGAAAQPALIQALSAPDPHTAAVAALALGRHGRRAIALNTEARAALVEATEHDDAGVRYAAVYALARETEPPEDAAVAEALWARIADASADVRAQAINALGKRKLLASAGDRRASAEQLLRDRDFRVAIEAVRAFGAAAETKAPLANALGGWWSRLRRGATPRLAQVITEAERVLQTTPLTEADQTALRELASAAKEARNLPALTRGWIECLAQQGLVRAQTDPDYAVLEQCGLSDEWRLPLVAELIDAGIGSLEARRNAIGVLVAGADPRVRSAGIGVLGSLAKAGEDVDKAFALQQLVAALGSTDLMVVAAAAESAGAVYEVLGEDEQKAIDAALLQRVQTEKDPEVGAALLGLVADRKLADGKDSCRAALSGSPVLAAAAAGCLKVLGETLPERAAVAALPSLPPDIDVASVVGKQLRWHLETSRGDIEIDLRPDVAPWTVATIVALTKRGTYDGLAFHRVVPNFVVQGGDPTESGYGGPGFAIPVEPATVAESAGFTRGAVGIADAGRDSGGSQFFIMHGPAPYLDGRYSWFGDVVAGQEHADALLMGDEIQRASIDDGTRP